MFSSSTHPAVRNLVVITVLAFVLQILITRPAVESDFEKSANAPALTIHGSPQISVLRHWGSLDTDKVLQGQVWRLVTSSFLHNQFAVWPLIINMFFLVWFGRELETIYGSKSFTWFYLTAAVVSSLTLTIIQLATGERFPELGASGPIMATMMLYAIYHPTDQIRLFFVLPIPIWLLVAGYVVMNLQPALLALSGQTGAAGFSTVGRLAGLGYGYFFYRTGISLLSIFGPVLNAKTNRPRRTRTSSRPDDTEPTRSNRKQKGSPDRALENEVDRILQKISAEGRENLTAAEEATLSKASQRYRARSDN